MIYFLSDGEFIKVGFASNLASRMSSLQGGNARKIECICTAPGTIKLERRLHSVLRQRRAGEWYSPTLALFRLMRLIQESAPDDVSRVIPDFIVHEQEKKRRFIAVSRSAGDRAAASVAIGARQIVVDMCAAFGVKAVAKALGVSEANVRYWCSGSHPVSSMGLTGLGAHWPDRVASLFQFSGSMPSANDNCSLIALELQRMTNRLLARAHSVGLVAA